MKSVALPVPDIRGGQARREPQRNPGKHYRGALPPPPNSVCLEIDTPMEETWREVSPHHRTIGVQGSVVIVDFMHILGQKETIWNTIF